MDIFEELQEKLQAGDIEQVESLVQKALKEGYAPEELLNKGLISAMDEIGDKFSNNEIFVPEVLIAARAMNAGMALLKPRLVEDGVDARGAVVIGTVAGDLHDIGKNLVRMMLEGAGFEVIDLGTDVSAEEFVEAVRENDADVLAMSALLTTTMTAMAGVISEIEAAGLRDEVYIMVGGAPVTEGFADEVGADFYAADAAEAARGAKKAVSG